MTYTVSQVTESIGTITLDHERRRNALSHALVEEIIAALRSFQEAKVRVVILRAKPGAKVFSAGHDIDELPESRRDPLGWDDPLRQLVREIENYPGPVIAMVEGGVWGGATETVFACDLIVAAETATFAVTPAKLGVPYNVGGMLTFLNATGLRMAKEMTFTAQPIADQRGWGNNGMASRHHPDYAQTLERWTWPSPVMVVVRSVPHIRSTASGMMVPSWVRGPRGAPTWDGASRLFARMSRSTRRLDVRTPATRSRAQTFR